jgi:hypothetical protein
MGKSTASIAAVVGVGHTDWVDDYKRVRNGEKPHDSNGYATLAFNRALQDAGITRDEVDGLIVGPTTAYERMGEILNINPRWGGQADAVQAVLQAVLARTSGRRRCSMAGLRRWAAAPSCLMYITAPGA